MKKILAGIVALILVAAGAGGYWGVEQVHGGTTACSEWSRFVDRSSSGIGNAQGQPSQNNIVFWKDVLTIRNEACRS